MSILALPHIILPSEALAREDAFTMPDWFWVAVGFGIFCCWPLALPGEHWEAVPPLVLLFAGTVAFARWRVSSARLGYFEGLRIVTRAFVSFNDNLTALYIAPIVIGTHLLGVYFGVRSLFEGRKAGRRRWVAFVRATYDRRYGPAAVPFEEMLAELRKPPEVMLMLPVTRRRWHQRYLLLYLPREGRTFLYHAGFYMSVLLAISFTWLFTTDGVPTELEDEPAFLGGVLLWLALGVYCYRVARIRDRDGAPDRSAV